MRKTETKKKTGAKAGLTRDQLTTRYNDLYQNFANLLIRVGVIQQLLIEHRVLSSAEIDERVKQLVERATLAYQTISTGGKLTEEIEQLHTLLARHKGPAQ